MQEEGEGVFSSRSGSCQQPVLHVKVRRPASPSTHDFHGIATKILRLRNAEDNRVIGALGVAVQAAHGAAGVDSGGVDDLAQVAAADVMRATERGQDAAWLKHRKRAQMDFLVTPEGVGDRTLCFGEARRIQE